MVNQPLLKIDNSSMKNKIMQLIIIAFSLLGLIVDIHDIRKSVKKNAGKHQKENHPLTSRYK